MMENFLTYRFLGNPVENFIWFAGILLAGIAFKRMLSKGLSYFLFRLVKKYTLGLGAERFFALLKRPIEILVLLFAGFFACSHLNFPIEWKVGPKEIFGVRMIIHRSFYTSLSLAFTWILLRMVDFFGMSLSNKPGLAKSEIQLIVYLKEAVKIIVITFALIFVLGSVFKVDITSLIAGLGIGGLAVALAAKESLENLIASCTIFFDKSFIAGDSIKTGKIEGVVEKIGFRSTLIQTPEKSFLSVPNKKLVEGELDNISRRTEQKVQLVLSLQYGLSTEKLMLIINAIKTYIDGLTIVNIPENRVTLIDLSFPALKIEVVYFVVGNNAPAYFETRQNVNLKILDIVAQHGGVFAVGIT